MTPYSMYPVFDRGESAMFSATISESDVNHILAYNIPAVAALDWSVYALPVVCPELYGVPLRAAGGEYPTSRVSNVTPRAASQCAAFLVYCAPTTLVPRKLRLFGEGE